MYKCQWLPQNPNSLIEQIIYDVTCFTLALVISEKNKLFREELNDFGKMDCQKRLGKNIESLSKHNYFTSYAKVS
jgi:hypothetical protein